jgi:hypothetical protein
MTQSIQSTVFIQFQEFLQRRYEKERSYLIKETRELRKAQSWRQEELEGWKAGELEAEDDEEWTMGLNDLLEAIDELDLEEEKLEKLWNENEMRKPNMVR